jgi:hypothetical protein
MHGRSGILSLASKFRNDRALDKYETAHSIYFIYPKYPLIKPYARYKVFTRMLTVNSSLTLHRQQCCFWEWKSPKPWPFTAMCCLWRREMIALEVKVASPSQLSQRQWVSNALCYAESYVDIPTDCLWLHASSPWFIQAHGIRTTFRYRRESFPYVPPA